MKQGNYGGKGYDGLEGNRDDAHEPTQAPTWSKKLMAGVSLTRLEEEDQYRQRIHGVLPAIRYEFSQEDRTALESSIGAEPLFPGLVDMSAWLGVPIFVSAMH